MHKTRHSSSVSNSHWLNIFLRPSNYQGQIQAGLQHKFTASQDGFCSCRLLWLLQGDSVELGLTSCMHHCKVTCTWPSRTTASWPFWTRRGGGAQVTNVPLLPSWWTNPASLLSDWARKNELVSAKWVKLHLNHPVLTTHRVVRMVWLYFQVPPPLQNSILTYNSFLVFLFYVNLLSTVAVAQHLLGLWSRWDFRAATHAFSRRATPPCLYSGLGPHSSWSSSLSQSGDAWRLRPFFPSRLFCQQDWHPSALVTGTTCCAGPWRRWTWPPLSRATPPSPSWTSSRPPGRPSTPEIYQARGGGLICASVTHSTSTYFFSEQVWLTSNVIRAAAGRARRIMRSAWNFWWVRERVLYHRFFGSLVIITQRNGGKKKVSFVAIQELVQ